MAETPSKPPARKAAARAAMDLSDAKAAPKAAKAAASSDKPAATKAKAVSRARKAPAEAPIALVVVPKPVVKGGGKTMVVSDEQRYRMVAEAAYYRAESNHFKSDPVRDWIEAEGDIAALLGGSTR